MSMFYDSEADGVEEDYARGFNVPAPKEKPGLLARAGMGLARGYGKFYKGLIMASTPFTGSTPENEEHFSGVFKEMDELIGMVTPDPYSVGLAGQAVDAISELPGQLPLGPVGLINSVVMNTGADLVAQGVDAKTATGAAIGTGLVTGGMMMVPGAGQTIKKTVGAVAAQPLLGAGQRGATKLYLESEGYNEQAGMFDPLDTKSLITDTALSAVFGVLGYRANQAAKPAGAGVKKPVQPSGVKSVESPLNSDLGSVVEAESVSERLRSKLPVKVEDSLDTLAVHQKARRATPFDEATAPGVVEVHLEAYEKALDDVVQGRPVDVVPILQAADEGLRAEVMADQGDAVASTGGLPYRQHQLAEEAHAQSLLQKELADLDSERKVETQFVAEEGQRDTSGALAAIERLPQEKWSGQELLAKLRKVPALKEEVERSGLDKFLTRQNRVSKDDVRAFLSDRQARETDAFKLRLLENGVEENSPTWKDLVGRFEGGARFRAVDPITGLGTKADFELALPRLWEQMQKAKRGAYTEFDIANVGGMNENIGEFHTDRVIADIAEIIKQTFQEHGIADVQLFRNGGDELQAVSLSSPEAQAKAAQAAQAKVAGYVQANGLQDAYGRTLPGMPKNTTKSGTGLYQATVDMYGHADTADAIDRARVLLNKEKIKAKEAAHGQELSQGTRAAAPGEQPGRTPEGLGSEGTGDRGTASGSGPEARRETAGGAVEPSVGEAPLSLSKEPLGYEVETILAERGDMVVVTGTDAQGNPTTVTSARQLIAEAQADIENTKRMESAYKRAALCLGLD